MTKDQLSNEKAGSTNRLEYALYAFSLKLCKVADTANALNIQRQNYKNAQFNDHPSIVR